MIGFGGEPHISGAVQRTFRLARALAIGGLLASGLVAACGSDSERPPVEGPLPTGPDDAQAYSEQFLAENPRAELRPELLAVAHLEPGGGPEDTCANRAGVDCLPYVFEDSTLLTLAGEDAPDELAQVVLRDRAGAVMLTLEPSGEPVSALIAPGDYVLELHHADPGDRNAPDALVFVRPEESDGTAGDTALAARAADAETDDTAVRTTTLAVSRDCVNCNFDRADLRGQNFDGATLTGSTFNGALMSKTSFRSATMIACSLRDLRPVDPAAPFDADFTGATMTFSQFSFLAPSLQVFTAIFRGAQLDETVWKSEGSDANLCKGVGGCSILNPDFRNANLRLARFPAMRLQSSFLPFAAHRCTFQGADLANADFRPAFPRTATVLDTCRFDREPDSGRVTSFSGASLAQVSASSVGGKHGGDFSDADFTDAILSLANFSGPNKDHPTAGAGAIMRRANFTRATFGGTIFAGADLSDAIIRDLDAGKFGAPDLRATKLSGVDFSGSVLTRADFGPAAPFTQGTPGFAGAILTDGVRGASFARQKFPESYGGLAGLDLTGADFTGADLLAVNFEGTTLNGAQMVGANLSFANLRRAKLRGAVLGVEPRSKQAAASLHGAFMPDVDLSDADLRTVDLSSAHLYGDTQQTLLIRTRLDSATLTHAVCSGTHFSGSFNATEFIGAQLVNAVFNGATLTNAKFDDAYLQGADFSAAIDGTGCSLNNAAVSATPGTWTFKEQNGTPFTFRYEATKLGPLGTEPSVKCPNAALGPCCPTGDVAQCLTEKLKPRRNGPHPPIPACVPMAPRFDNCLTPRPTATPRPTPTPTPSN